MLQDGVQFYIEILCVLQARYFKDTGNYALNLDGIAQAPFLHMIVMIISVVITN